MIDSHAHIDQCESPEEEVVARAVKAGIKRILTVGAEPDSHADALQIAAYREPVYAALGWHPHEAATFTQQGLEELALAANGDKVRAIGETGLDFYRDLSPREDQERAFIAQIDLARQLDLAVIIHTRAAEQETFKLLSQHAKDLTVVIHCFSTPDSLDECIDKEYFCSFAGNITFPKAVGLQEAARNVPLELLLVETDAPYLAPQSLRGKPNEPANVRETAERVAELRSISYEDLEEAVEVNAAQVFKW